MAVPGRLACSGAAGAPVIDRNSCDGQPLVGELHRRNGVGRSRNAGRRIGQVRLDPERKREGRLRRLLPGRSLILPQSEHGDDWRRRGDGDEKRGRDAVVRRESGEPRRHARGIDHRFPRDPGHCEDGGVGSRRLQPQTRKAELRATARRDRDAPLVRVARDIEKPKAGAVDRQAEHRGRNRGGSHARRCRQGSERRAAEHIDRKGARSRGAPGHHCGNAGEQLAPRAGRVGRGIGIGEGGNDRDRGKADREASRHDAPLVERAAQQEAVGRAHRDERILCNQRKRHLGSRGQCRPDIDDDGPRGVDPDKQPRSVQGNSPAAGVHGTIHQRVERAAGDRDLLIGRRAE